MRFLDDIEVAGTVNGISRNELLCLQGVKENIQGNISEIKEKIRDIDNRFKWESGTASSLNPDYVAGDVKYYICGNMCFLVFWGINIKKLSEEVHHDGFPAYTVPRPVSNVASPLVDALGSKLHGSFWISGNTLRIKSAYTGVVYTTICYPIA